MWSRAGTVLCGLFLAVTLVVTGCADNAKQADSPTATTTASPSAEVSRLGGCLGPDKAKLLSLPAAGARLDAAVMGDGGSGVVIAYERNGSVCTWLPLAEALVARRYRVALFDYSGVQTPQQDVALVTTELRRQGVRRVFLIGGSLGGAAVLHGGVEITPPVAGVANIAGGLPDGEALARRLRVPLLLVAARNDTILQDLDAPAPRWMNQLYRAAATAPDRQLVLVPGTEHASQLFISPQAQPVEDAIVAFLDRHNGP
jgi:pimeloyl-ACP methyl ester carboxylesterase